MEELRVPNSWVYSYLENVCTKPQYGWTSKADKVKGRLKLLRTTDISSGRVDWSGVPFCLKLPKDPSQYYLKNGDIVVSRAGSVGLSFLIKEDINDAIFASYLVRFKSLIESEYIHYFMRSQMYWNQIQEKSAGIAVPNVNASKLSALRLPIAPLNEQKRIVDKIETLFSGLDKGEALIKQVQKQLATYRQSVLKAAVTGELTKDWREQNQHRLESGEKLLQRILKTRRDNWQGRGKYKEPVFSLEGCKVNLPESWFLGSLDQVCSKITDGTHHSPANGKEGEYKYITAKNIKEWGIDLSNITYVNKQVHEEIYARCDVKKDDVLYIKDGATTGIATVNELNEEFSLLSSVGVFRPLALLNSYYLSLVLNGPVAKRPLLKRMAGSAITRLTLTKLKVTPIPVPSSEEQEEIVDRVSDIFSQINAMEKWCEEGLKRSINLRQSILKDAFSGKLVPQEPDDEPASELLKRIQAEHAQSPKTSRPAKKKTKQNKKATAA